MIGVGFPNRRLEPGELARIVALGVVDYVLFVSWLGDLDYWVHVADELLAVQPGARIHVRMERRGALNVGDDAALLVGVARAFGPLSQGEPATTVHDVTDIVTADSELYCELSVCHPWLGGPLPQREDLPGIQLRVAVALTSLGTRRLQCPLGWSRSVVTDRCLVSDQMPPSTTREDTADCSPGDAMQTSQCLSSEIPRSILTPYQYDSLIGQPGTGMLLPPVGGGVHPSLLLGITGIVRLSAQEQVIRAHTRRIVALMADTESVGDWTEVEFPRDSGCYARVGIWPTIDAPVAAGVVTAGPEPATISLTDSGPEPLREGCAILGLHNGDSFRCATPPAVSSSAEASSRSDYSTQKVA